MGDSELKIVCGVGKCKNTSCARAVTKTVGKTSFYKAIGNHISQVQEFNKEREIIGLQVDHNMKNIIFIILDS